MHAIRHEEYTYITIDCKLSCRQSSHHEQTCANTSVRPADTEFLGDLEQAAGGSLSGKTLSLVDLAEHGVGGLGDNSGSKTSHETGAQVDDGLSAGGDGGLVDTTVDLL